MYNHNIYTVIMVRCSNVIKRIGNKENAIIFSCGCPLGNPRLALSERGTANILNNRNPSDYAIHLTRRTRGLPFWFSLAANGTDAYRDAMEYTMLIAKKAVELIKVHPNLELLMEPELSIVAFTRKGWSKEDYQSWSDKLLRDQIGFVTPSSHEGKPILRFAIVNPWTNVDDIEKILETL